MNSLCHVVGKLLLLAACLCALVPLGACKLEVSNSVGGEADGGEDADAGPNAHCDADHYDHDGDAATPCIAYTVCTPGQYVSQQPSERTDRACSACKSGSFSKQRSAVQDVADLRRWQLRHQHTEQHV